MAEREELCCEVHELHKDRLDFVSRNMPAETELYDLAELFKTFGDSTRIRILYVLFEAEMCVCDIAEVLRMTQSAISHQLRLLKQAKLVKIDDVFCTAANHAQKCFSLKPGREHLCKAEQPGGCCECGNDGHKEKGNICNIHGMGRKMNLVPSCIYVYRLYNENAHKNDPWFDFPVIMPASAGKAGC